LFLQELDDFYKGVLASGFGMIPPFSATRPTLQRRSTGTAKQNPKGRSLQLERKRGLVESGFDIIVQCGRNNPPVKKGSNA
jgi:hypothetical protein